MNVKSNLRTIGASVASDEDRETNDYYATEPIAVELLLKSETFNKHILEPCCGEGHISKVLMEKGYDVVSSDLIDRGFGEQKDFFDYTEFNGDIVTNPPYKYAKEIVEKSLEIIPEGNKVAMFLRIQFLEGIKRKSFFEKYPPKFVYVSSKRIRCAKNGEFDKYSNGAVMFAWFVWEKGYNGDIIVKYLK